MSLENSVTPMLNMLNVSITYFQVFVKNQVHLYVVFAWGGGGTQEQYLCTPRLKNENYFDTLNKDSAYLRNIPPPPG